MPECPISLPGTFDIDTFPTCFTEEDIDRLGISFYHYAEQCGDMGLDACHFAYLGRLLCAPGNKFTNDRFIHNEFFQCFTWLALGVLGNVRGVSFQQLFDRDVIQFFQANCVAVFQGCFEGPPHPVIQQCREQLGRPQVCLLPPSEADELFNIGLLCDDPDTASDVVVFIAMCYFWVTGDAKGTLARCACL